MKYILFSFLLLLGAASFAAEGAVPTLSEKYKDAQFHYHKTANFEIVSIDPSVPIKVEKYLEELRTWSAHRWGLNNVATKPCMLVCFPTQEMFKDCLKVDYKEPKISVAKGLDGQDREVVTIWIVADAKGDWYKTTLPEKVGRAILIDYEQTYQIKLPLWVHLGTSYLNNDMVFVRDNLASLDLTQNYDVSDLFKMTNEDFVKKSQQDSHDIKVRAAYCCLMIRKELGDKAFADMLSAVSKGNTEAGIRKLGYSDIAQFGQVYNKYCRNLSHDMRSNRTPKFYLTWFVR